MKRYGLCITLVLLLLVAASSIGAQEDAEVQAFFGTLNGAEANVAFFDILDAVAGDTLYIYAESEEIDPYLTVCDIECVEIFAENDDLSQDTTNAALAFTFPQDGDYSVAVTDCCVDEASGEFWLLLGYNAPDVLTGNAEDNGGQIAVPYDPAPPAPIEPPAPITGPPAVQEFYAAVSSETNVSYFDLFGMQAGETIYLYAESNEIDPYLIVCDIDCEVTYAENDDIDSDNRNSALYYTFPENGDYSVAVADCCDENAVGAFYLLVGFNAPQVLVGEALPTGAVIAVPYEPTYLPIATQGVGDATQIQEFVGEINQEVQFVYYDIFDAVAGDTLYIYAESNEIDPYLIVCDLDCVDFFAENDNISRRNHNAAIEFTFPQDGDYSIAVADCCDDSATGRFVLQLGYNAPEVLRGQGIPNGAEIAQAFAPLPPPVVQIERTVNATCETAQPGPRPELSGPVQTVNTDNFSIHYTTEGEDAAVPSFVAEVVAFVESTLEAQTQGLSWPVPPQDCGEGGDARFDFYLKDILKEDILGYAQPEAVIGDNPNSPLSESWASYGYMVIENDFQGVTAPLSVMRATIAHEFNHIIQFGYDIAEPARWLYEATASWTEIRTLPDEEDATRYTQAVFQAPNLCIGSLNEETGVRIYGEWLLIDSLAQDFGDEGIIHLWEFIADQEGMGSYYSFLDAMEMSPQDVLRRYAVRNLLRAYPKGTSLPITVSVKGVINGAGIIAPEGSGVEQMGVDYVLIRRRGNYTFTLDGNSDLSLTVVGIDRGTNQVQVFDLGQSGTVDTSGFSNAYVIILNNAVYDDMAECAATNWQLTVSDGAGAAQTPANGEVFDASNFAPAG